jgi:hypothetical protein
MEYMGMSSYNMSNEDLLSSTKVKEENKVNDTTNLNTANVIQVDSSNSNQILQGLGLLLLIMIGFGFYGSSN